MEHRIENLGNLKFSQMQTIHRIHRHCHAIGIDVLLNIHFFKGQSRYITGFSYSYRSWATWSSLSVCVPREATSKPRRTNNILTSWNVPDKLKASMNQSLSMLNKNIKLTILTEGNPVKYCGYMILTTRLELRASRQPVARWPSALCETRIA